MEAVNKFEIDPLLVKMLVNEAGLPAKFVASLNDGTDWFFVVRIHSMLETALNQLILTAIGDKRLASIVSHLDTGDRKRGKLAFIKALELLPTQAMKFVTMIGELRNDLVHDISQFEFSFEEWIKKRSREALNNFIESLKFSVDRPRDIPFDRNVLKSFPSDLIRGLILVAALNIVAIAIDKKKSRMISELQCEYQRLQSLLDSYEGGKRTGAESVRK